MKRWIIGILIGLGAIGAGVGVAFLINKSLPTVASVTDQSPILQGLRQGRGMMNQPGLNRQDRGMMGQPELNGQGVVTFGERISMDDAVSKAEAYLKNTTQGLKVSEGMEFENNFYMVVTEADSGRGAMELLVDPISGNVTQEIGPNMMWNLKYGRMGRMDSAASDNSLTIAQALDKAQKALDEKGLNATVNADGISFYGYYTFDYSIDGKVSGMLSVNGLDGQVWLHTWHGDFIVEKEIK